MKISRDRFFTIVAFTVLFLLFCCDSAFAAWTWGYNACGQLGISPSDFYRYPDPQFIEISELKIVAAGKNYSMALKTDGTLFTWGCNGNGALGIGPPDIFPHPQPTQIMGNIKDMDTLKDHSIALDSNGNVLTWGDDYWGKLGRNGDPYTPGRVDGLTNIVKVAAGWTHSVALKSDGTVWTWGNNNMGQLGRDGITNRPGQVVDPDDPTGFLKNVVDITAGNTHTLSLKSDGTIYSWGLNNVGQLGIGRIDGERHQTPARVINLSDVEAIESGGMHSIAIRRSDKTIWTWGWNYYGQLGRNGNLSEPGQVVHPEDPTGFLRGIIAADGNQNHTVALRSDGTVWTWGANSNGELGIGYTDMDPHPRPTRVIGLTDITSVATGTYHTIASSGEITPPVTDMIPPSSTIVNAPVGNNPPGAVIQIIGTASDDGGSGVASVSVSTDGGFTWHTANDISGDSSWSNWNIDWALPACGSYNIRSQATDNAGNTETAGPGIWVTVCNLEPRSSIVDPEDESRLCIDNLYTITGTVTDETGAGITQVDVSINDGPWFLAIDASSDGSWSTWNYDWNLSGLEEGENVLRSRARDSAGNVETPAPGVTVRLCNPYWTRQVGSNEDDVAKGVAIDKTGDIYVAGYTYGRLGDQPNRGGADLFVAKFNKCSGEMIWLDQRGTVANDIANDVSLDNDGNIYITGYTEGQLDQQTNKGRNDLFVIKYDSSGNWQWTELRGTAAEDVANSIYVDGRGDIYITGFTFGNLDERENKGRSDLFVVKYDPDGNWQWTGLGGTDENDFANDIQVAFGDGIFVTGYTMGNFGGNIQAGSGDVFVAAYQFTNSTFEEKWVDTYAAKWKDVANSISISEDNKSIYVAGYTQEPVGGTTHYLMIKYDALPPYAGQRKWVYEGAIVTSKHDFANGVSVDRSGNAYVAGTTDLGRVNFFIDKFESTGNRAWWKIRGTPVLDNGEDVVADKEDNTILVGSTAGQMEEGAGGNGLDFFVTRITHGEPTSTIIQPSHSATISGPSILIFGTAESDFCSEIIQVQVSTNGGRNWNDAIDTSGSGNNWSYWRYSWQNPSIGTHIIKSRAMDSAGNVEKLGDGITVFVE